MIQQFVSHTPSRGWFDEGAENYSQSRPTYPSELFKWIADHAPALNNVWDVACGNGQASIGLAKHFLRVDATDLSPAQISRARVHRRISYQVAAAEKTPLVDRSLDAIVVGTAIHWLNVPKFNQEALRTLRPNGLMVWMGYAPLQGAPIELQAWLNELYYQRLRDLWPPQRHHVDTQYRELPFPGPSEIMPQDLKISLEWGSNDLTAFIRSWSALRRAHQLGVDLLPQLDQEIQAIWPGESILKLNLPIMGRWGQLNT